MTTVERWGRFEWHGDAKFRYENPVADLHLSARFTAPDGSTHATKGFWDGKDTWRVRFSPHLSGEWRFQIASDPADPGLNAEASFRVLTYSGDNPLYRHGRVNVTPGDHILRHADGTPFFWLGDTAWNGPLKASLPDWRRYLKDRREKHFNVVQFVTTQWLAAAGNADARLAYVGSNPIEIDPIFFQWMDERIDALNDAGFLGAAVIAWAAIWHRPALGLSPGTSLPETEVACLARYLLARYGAHHICWILAGDGRYEGAEADRWRRIGRESFGDRDVLATIHPGGHIWVEHEFRSEPWFRFNGYQSGHWRSPEAAEWITSGPASKSWAREPAMPHINLEFCYEAHKNFDTGVTFNDRDIRRDAYSSLLATVPAGLTYGCHGIWSWEAKQQPPMSHPKTGDALPWHEALILPGSTSMTHLHTLMASIEWWRLKPAPDLLEYQPGLADPLAFICAAKSEEGDLALIYTPGAREITIRAKLLRSPVAVELIDPATGHRRPYGIVSEANLLNIHLDTTADALILFRPA